MGSVRARGVGGGVGGGGWGAGQAASVGSVRCTAVSQGTWSNLTIHPGGPAVKF